MSNIKISNLPQTNYISDDALIPLVQSNQNNVVTVKQLSDKVGERHDRAIAELWHELKKVGGGEFVPKVKNALASQQWQINELKKQNGFKDREQDNQLVLLNKALRDTVSKQIQHGNQIALLNAAMKQANSNIETLQTGVANLAVAYSYTKQYVDDTNAYMNSAYTYLSQYVHFSPFEYWENDTNTVEDIYKY